MSLELARKTMILVQDRGIAESAPIRLSLGEKYFICTGVHIVHKNL